MELIKFLPDMYPELLGLDIQPDLCQGSVRIEAVQHYRNEQLTKTEHLHKFFIDRITSDQKDHLLRSYRSRNPNIELKRDLGSNIYLELMVESVPSEEEVNTGWFPGIADNINGQKFYILRPEDYLSELAAHFVLLFCLGMLSRYYPDIWMKAIDENVQIAEFTDSLLNVIYRKFPNLILDQMTRVKHYVHI